MVRAAAGRWVATAWCGLWVCQALLGCGGFPVQQTVPEEPVGPALGEEGGACRVDGTCNPTLRCVADRCVNPLGVSSSAGSGGQGSSGSAGSSGSLGSSGGSNAGSSSGVVGFGVAPIPEVADCPRVDMGTGVDEVRVGQRVRVGAPGGVGGGPGDGSVGWRVVHAPSGSRAVVSALAAQEAYVTALSASGVDVGLDVPGDVVLEATHSADGGVSAARCRVRVGAPQGLTVVLLWDTDSDVDLHLIRADGMGRFCDASGIGALAEVSVNAGCLDGDVNVCSYVTCLDSDRPEWDGLAGPTAGDPRLLRDQRSAGVEVVQLARPPPGEFLVVAHQTDAPPRGIPNVQALVFAAGKLLSVHTGVLTLENELRPLTRVVWPATGAVCVQDAFRGGPNACDKDPSCVAGVDCPPCAASEDCGPGAGCNVDTGHCQPLLVTDCLACPEGRRCIPATHQCRADECMDCDETETCQESTRVCLATPAGCAETDEPNHTVGMPGVLPPLTAELPASVESVICRFDTDLWTLTAPGATYLEASLAQLDGLALGDSPTVELLQGGQPLAALRRYRSTLGAPVAAGPALLRLTGLAHAEGPAEAPHQQRYRLSVRTLDTAPCGLDPSEPNDTPETAMHALVAPGQTTGVLCAVTDPVDHLLYVQPAGTLSRVTALTLGYPLVVQVQATEPASTPETVSEAVLILAAPDAPATWLFTARRDVDEGLEVAAAYRLTVDETPLPACPDQALEPNGTREAATLMPAANVTGALCRPEDRDHWRFTVTSAGTLMADVAWENAALDVDAWLYDALTGTELTSGTTTGTDAEHLEAPLIPGDYVLEVAGYNVRWAAIPLGYTITLGGVPLAFPPPGSSSSGSAPSSSASASSTSASSTSASSTVGSSGASLSTSAP